MNVKTTILASLFLGIGLFPIHAETLMTESMIVQQTKGIRISGTVLDKEKTPLPGVNVTVKKINRRYYYRCGRSFLY